MNKILKYTGIALLGMLAFSACSPDDYASPNGNNVPVAADYADNVIINVVQDENTAYFTFEAAPGVSPVWIIDGSQYSGDFTAKKYQRKAGDYKVELRVKNANGISNDALTFSYHIDKTRMNGFGGFDVDSPYNLFKGATVTQVAGYYAPGWSQIADPTVIHGAGNDFTVQLPVGTTDRWQAQVPFETNITTSESEETYDFSCILTSNKDFNVMVKFTNPNNDGDFYFAEEQAVKAGEPICFYMTEMPSRNIENLKLFFDFGGCPDATEVSVENLVFIPHSKNDIVAPEKGEPEPVWREAENLWTSANPQLASCYYAPGWAQIADPTVTIDGGVISISLPSATFERWQAQVPFTTDLGITDTNQEYDFLAVVESNASFKGMFKLTQDGDDNNFLFAKEQDLVAGAETRVVVSKCKLGNPAEKMKLFFDFGGNPNNTEIRITKIILQTHKE